MSRSTEEIQRDIDATTSRLRDTSAALGYKADAPARAGEVLRQKVGTAKQQLASEVKAQLGRREGGRGRGRSDAASPGDPVSHGESQQESPSPATEARKENALLLGLGAAVAGAIAGLTLPLSESRSDEEQPAQRENEVTSQVQPAVDDVGDAGSGP